MIKKYIKKPVPVEAIQYTGDNIEEIQAFCGDNLTIESEWDTDLTSAREVPIVHTLEGDMRVTEGAYIAHGKHNDFWPIKEYIFNATYEEMPDVLV